MKPLPAPIPSLLFPSWFARCGRCLLVSLLGLISAPAFADGFVQQWAVDAGTHTSSLHVLLAVDSAGDVAVVRPGSSGFGITKYSGSTGAQMWQKFHVNNFGDLIPKGITVDNAGNFIVVGNAYLSPYYNCYVVKFSGSTGNQMWFDRTSFTGNAGHSRVTGVVLDSSNQVYVCGYGEVGGSRFGKVAKFSANGSMDWMTNDFSEFSSYSKFNALALDASGNIFVTGDGVDGMMAAKIDGSTRALSWSRSFYLNSSNRFGVGQAIKADSSGNVFVTGFSSTSPYDYVTAKINGASGALLWQDNYNGPSNGDDRAYALILDSSGDPIITGYSYDSTSGNFPFTRKYSSASGTVLWSQRTDYGGLNLSFTPAGKLLSGGTDYNGGNYRSGVSETNVGTGALISATTLPPSFGLFQDPPGSYEPPPPNTLPTPDGGFVVLGLNYQTLRLSKYAADTTTQAPTLTTPASNATVGNPLSVSFTLPEAALAGSVKLSFGAAQLTLANTHLSSGAHSFSFNPANPTASADIASGAAIPSGTYTVTLSYQDTSGNPAASASNSNVTVDLTPPVFSDVPANISTGSTSVDGAVVTFTSPTATDAIDGVSSVTCVPASGSTFPIGTTTVTCTASDTRGNSASATFTVTVIDTAPVITTPSSASVASTSATLGGNVTSDGGVAITERGIVLAPTSANANPQLGGASVVQFTTTGTTGVFTLSASGLSPSTGYTFRAYAINGQRTAYSPTGTFTTLSNNADLSGLVLNVSGTDSSVNPSFSSAITSYTRNLNYSQRTAVKVRATRAQAAASITVNGTAVASGTNSDFLSLVTGNNTCTIVVTAEDPAITKTYTITFAVLPDDSPGSLDGLDLNVIGTAGYAVVEQPDGKIILAGDFTSVLGTARNNLARLNIDGTLDTAFNPSPNAAVRCVAVQPDGKLLIGGDFTSSGGTERNYAARLNADGTLDTGFDPKPNAAVNCITLQADGKVVYGGHFTTLQSNGLGIAVSRAYIARVKADGSLDIAFDPKANAVVNSIDLIPGTGELLMGGDFTSLQPNGGASVTRTRLALLSSAGAVLPALTTTADGAVQTLLRDAATGAVFIGGDFTQVNGSALSKIAKLASGTYLPSGADYTNRPNGSVTGQALGSGSNKVQAVTGAFSSLQPLGLARSGVGLFQADLSHDAAFDPNASGGSVHGITFLSGGKAWLAGSFTHLQANGAPSPVARRLFARLNRSANSPTLVLTQTQAAWTVANGGTQVNHVTFELSTDGGTTYTPLGGVVSYGSNGSITVDTSELTLPTSGHIRARARTSGGWHNGSSGMVQQVASFSGTGSPEIVVELANGTNLESGDTASFADIPMRSTGTLQLTIRNTGNANLSLTNILDEGKDAQALTAGTLPSYLAPNQSATVSLSCTPQRAGTISVRVHISNNDFNEKTFSLNLTGNVLPALPTVVTEFAGGSIKDGVTFSGKVTDDGGTPIIQRGIVFGLASQVTTPVIGDTQRPSPGTTGAFSVSRKGLSPGTAYRWRAYAENASGISYGEARTHTTSQAPPTIASPTVSNITTTSATLGADITSLGGATTVTRGVRLRFKGAASWPPYQSATSSATGTFGTSVAVLENATYEFQAYVQNSAGSAETAIGTFTTPLLPPRVPTHIVSQITASSASVSVTVSSPANADQQVGFLFAKTADNAAPTLNGAGVTSQGANRPFGGFEAKLGRLLPGTSYSVRAYATNASGTTYGTTATFTTLAPYPLTISSPQSFTREYGQANPFLYGSITGLQPGDNITATFSTDATATSVPGTYKVTPKLSDPDGKLGWYAVTIVPGTLTITKTLVTPVVPSVTTRLTGASQTVTLRATMAGVSEGNIRFTISSINGVIGTAVNSPVVNGEATASYLLPANITVGAKNISVGYTGGTSYRDASATGTLTVIDPPEAASLDISAITSTITAGTPASFQVRARTIGGQTAASYRGTVTFSSSDVTANLPAAYTFTAADSGVKTVSLTFIRAGSKTLTATDADSALTSTLSSISVRVAPDPPNKRLAFGLNDHGQLGLGDFTNRSSPTEMTQNIAVTPGGAGYYHTVGVKAGYEVSDNEAYGWGGNVWRAVGNNSIAPATQPQPVSFHSVPSNRSRAPIQMAAGERHSMMINAEGRVFCWGSNLSNQCSYNPIVSFPAPSEQSMTTLYWPDLYRPWLFEMWPARAIAAGSSHSLALQWDGSVRAWGDSALLGIGPLPLGPSAEGYFGAWRVNGLFSGVIAIAAGSAHSLALKNDGTVWAWGDNSNGQLGIGTASFASTPTQVKNSDGSPLIQIIAIAAGYSHSLALTSSGQVLAWGDGADGQLGSNSAYYSRHPQWVKGVGGSGYLYGVMEIACGRRHSLARLSDGTVVAWGLGRSGQLGHGSLASSYVPVLVSGVRRAVSVASGPSADHSFVSLAPVTASSFEVTKPDTVQSGQPFTFSLTALDASNNQVAFQDTLHFSSDDRSATLPAAYAFTSSDSGQKTFTATLRAGGNNRIFVTDGKGLSFTITVPTTGAASKVSVSSVSVPTSSTEQALVLDCLVLADARANANPQGGLCTATLKDSGGTVIGTPSVSGEVSAGGKVAIYYTLPANTPAGTYTLEVSYSGDTFFNTSTGTGTVRVGVNGIRTGIGIRSSGAGISSLGVLSTEGQTGGTRLGSGGSGGGLRIADAGFVVDPAFSTTFSLEARSVTLTASVSASAGTVNAGSMTFTLLKTDGTLIGTPVSAPVLNDQATVSYDLPAALPVGEYDLRLSYSGSPLLEASEGAQIFTVLPAESITTVADATLNYSAFAQSVLLQASVTSTAGTLSSGSVSFQLKDPAGDNLGTAVSGAVVNGEASVTYALPAGLVPSPYVIEATYSGVGSDVLGSTDSAHTLTIEGAAASTSIAVADVDTVFSDQAQTVVLSATVTSNGSIANDGVVSFQLSFNGTAFGEEITSDIVTNGAASVTVELPANTVAGSYQIAATYSGGFGLSGSTGYGALTISNPSEARLINLSFNNGSITPTFDPNSYTYTAVVPNTVTEVSVAPTALDGEALIQVNSAPAATGFALATVPLGLGTNAIQTLVTAPDGVSNRLYRLNLRRQTGYETWRADNGASDNATNLMRYAFGLSPGGSGEEALILNGGGIAIDGYPTVNIDKSGTSFSYFAMFGRRKDWAEAGLSYAVQFSGDTVNWTTSTNIPTPIASDADSEAVVVRYPFFVNGKKAQFFRVVVDEVAAP